MKSESRYKIIEHLLNERGSLSVKELAELTYVSEATIRRDLVEMEKRDILQRLWGGAKIIEQNAENDISNFGENYLLRFSKNTQQKEKIAEYANNLILDNATIFIDGGSTLAKMFDYLSASNLTVVTNCIFNIEKLASNHIKTFLPRGYLNYQSAAILSVETIEDVGSLNYDYAFIGASGIDAHAGFSTRSNLDAKLKEAVIKQSAKTFVLADSSKYGIRCTYTFSKIDEIPLITDSAPDFDIENIIVI